MGYDIIEAMNNRITKGMKDNTGSNKGMPNSMTRDIGGFKRQNQPYISGYFQVFFELPMLLFTGSETESASWLHSTCEGITPPTQTINKIDIVGQGQIGSSFPSSTTTTREFTLTFREYQNLPVLNTIRTWNSLFDPHLGVSQLSGTNFIPLSYKGRCYVGLTKPTMGTDSKEGNGSGLKRDDFEEILFFDGAFPVSTPIDTAISTDITSNESVQHSVSFSFDGFPITLAEGQETLIDKFSTLLNGYKYMSTYDNRYKNMTI